MEFWTVAGIISAIKLLFLPSYHSTDFEVHRNWLAITHSLPPNKWYYESTSEWTLDYPPLFAWFEFLLSQVAQLFDPQMLDVNNMNYSSERTVLFQRLSVIVTDLVFLYAVKEYSEHCLHAQSKTEDVWSYKKNIITVLLATNAGLLIVDHIHFQYNGFLFGLLLFSILRMSQGRFLESALWFAVLLNFKHIFLYLSPAYFIFLLRNYCFSSTKDGTIRLLSFSIKRFVLLGMIVLFVFTLSIGPFVYMGQLGQLLSRLFPFKRGLCHAYWAPNFWALYNVADKALLVVGSRFGLVSAPSHSSATMTGGLVQEFDHVVLPSIKPIVTLACTAVSILPVVTHTWLFPSGPRGFLRCLILCAYGSFMFGWHVHEKAVLLMIIPLGLLAMEKKKDAQIFLLLSTVGHFSLFPLFFTQAETPLKYMIVAAYTLAAFHSMGKLYGDAGTWYRLPLLSVPESFYIAGLIPLEIYCQGIHHVMGLQHKLPFLPLLLTSVYCAIGITYSWIKYNYICLTDRTVRVLLKAD